MSGVRIKNLVKNYGSVVAVSGVNLDVKKGEFVVLLGPSGCGKTTTLRCVAGLESISDGEISIGGVVVSAKTGSVPPEERSIGMVFQSYAIWPHMTVAENIAFGLKVKRLSRSEIADRVDSVLEVVGLSGFGSRGASQLSGGQQQRVALARAVVLEPKVLLFDEPLSNLDARLRERMRSELRELQQRLGITALYVTHDQQEAMAMADRIVLMNKGRMEQIGSPLEVYERPATTFCAEFVGLTNLFAVTSSRGNQVEVGNAWLTTLHAVDDCNAFNAVIRPEHVRILDQKEHEPNTIPGVIRNVLYLGSVAEYVVEAAGLSFRIQESPPAGRAASDEVWLQIKPEHVILVGDGFRSEFTPQVKGSETDNKQEEAHDNLETA